MGRKHAKSIRNAKAADILRRKILLSVPSISSNYPSFGDFKTSGVTENVNYHMGKQDLIPISSISIPTGLNQINELFSENSMKVNADEVSSGNSIPSFASTVEHKDDFKSDVTASSDMVSLKDFDPIVKSTAADVHPAVHGSDYLHSNSLKSSANSSHKAINPGSWVDLFKKNRTFSENCGRLTEIKLSHNFVDLRGSLKNDVADLCLLGSFSSSFPGKDAILKLRNSWNVSCHVHFHVSKWVIFKFDNSIDMDMVLRGGPYCFFGKPMRIFKMPRFFNFSTDLFSVICVWVKFPNLPLNLWNDDDLSRICSFLGKPLYTDLLTKQRLNLDYARCLVEIDVSQNLHNLIPILLADGTILHQPVVYEDLPLSCTLNDHVFDKDGIKSELDNEIVNECGVKNDVVHEVVSDVNEVCRIKPECLRFGSLDFDVVSESILGSKDVDKADVEVVGMVAVKVLDKNDEDTDGLKNDEDTDGLKTDVVDSSLIINAENPCEKYDDSSSENDASALICDNDDDVCVHLDDSVVVNDDLVVEKSEHMNGNCDGKSVEMAGEKVLGGGEIVDDVILDANSATDVDKEVDDVVVESDSVDDSYLFAGDISVKGAPFATFDDVGCNVDQNSATDEFSESEKDEDSVDIESEVSGDVDVVDGVKRFGRMVSVAPDATFEEKISACKQAGMRGRLVSLGDKPFEVDLDLYDDSGRLWAAVPLTSVDGVVSEGIDESDDDDYDSNDVDDNDDDFEASDVESDEDIEANEEQSRVFLHNYTLKVLKEAEEGGYIKCNIKCNVRPKPNARAKEIILTEDDIDMDLYNEGIRLGKY